MPCGIILPNRVGSHKGVTWCSPLALENWYQWSHHTQKTYFSTPSDNSVQQITKEVTTPSLLAVRHSEDKFQERISSPAGMQEDDSHFCSPLLQESGLSVWIGGRLHPLEGVPPPVAVILITVVIALFTEFASNTATIIIFLPVLAELVRSSHGMTSSSSAPSLPCPTGGQVCVGPVLEQALGSFPAPGLQDLQNPWEQQAL